MAKAINLADKLARFRRHAARGFELAIALDEAVSTGAIQRGDLVLMVVFGAGLTWSAAVIEW